MLSVIWAYDEKFIELSFLTFDQRGGNLAILRKSLFKSQANIQFKNECPFNDLENMPTGRFMRKEIGAEIFEHFSTFFPHVSLGIQMKVCSLLNKIQKVDFHQYAV